MPSKTREVQSTLYGFTGHSTLCSHAPKKNKAVVLLSTMHHSAAMDQFSGKPEIIGYYNSTKGGVDELDKKCSIYTTSRRSRRWPLTIFYRVLDLSSVNAYILYKMHHKKDMDRGDFMKQLARELVVTHMQRRVLNSKLPRDLRLTMARILGPDNPRELPAAESEPKKRRRCYTCDPKKNRKSNYSCISCKKTICLQCAAQICQHCQ